LGSIFNNKKLASQDATSLPVIFYSAAGVGEFRFLPFSIV